MQTMNDDLAQVYRQRIYSFDLMREADTIRLTIYRMNDEARYRNAWKDPDSLASISIDQLTSLPGCEV